MQQSIVATWRCQYAHCREMTIPSRSRTPDRCNFCDTLKGARAPDETPTMAGAR